MCHESRWLWGYQSLGGDIGNISGICSMLSVKCGYIVGGWSLSTLGMIWCL
jgi:hypothetical protein